MGGGGKIPYPKHVWSPAGGWYAQPANWRGNTFIAGAVVFGIVAVVFNFSADRERRAHKPAAWESHISRRWATQLINWDKEDKATATNTKNDSA
ncbi:hypothetical protein VHEMI00518 [[Torrubiella] hemipterigena]|uniref:Uncharacterized protein n=1 Tax=[Torrubiella] hemipterigena TaxID=1531966 RepID=A0A0A1SJG3_9HYPO|nr:hypothetical protein VHEMI00518 [[Torrubiella] hemipterigena]